jgi:tight adherence protein B
MDPLILITVAVFLGVTALIGSAAMFLGGKSTNSLEDRLTMLTATGGTGSRRSDDDGPSLLASPLNETHSFADRLIAQVGDLRSYLDQAGVRSSPARFAALSMILGAVSTVACVMLHAPVWFTPVAAVLVAALPLLFVVFKRKRRINAFAKQLPDALELVSRALRAGHSLAAGFNLVGSEMPNPIGLEFTRCYEEQNLGIPLEQALEGMTTRVPNLDLRFFATAVILQRQTGGDLAEILDKIGTLIRERFKVWGQIQALTGEGRLSGVVLLGLPPVLFLVMYRLNPEYCQVLFTDPMGQSMLWVAIFLQFVGALVIRKIINIKV